MRRGATSRRERTVHDGLEPNDDLIPREVLVTPEIVDAWERMLAEIDESIAKQHATRAAYIRLIADARRSIILRRATPTQAT